MEILVSLVSIAPDGFYIIQLKNDHSFTGASKLKTVVAGRKSRRTGCAVMHIGLIRNLALLVLAWL